MTNRPMPQPPAPASRPTRVRLVMGVLGATTYVVAVACGSASVPETGLKGGARLRGVQGFHQAAAGPVSGRKVIGNNDLVPVAGNGDNVPPQFRNLLDAFGRISVSCTATHIGHGIVVTAGHCFRATSMREGNLTCDHIKVEWGVRKGIAPYMVSTCQVILAQETSDSADYAIFKVDEAPRATARISDTQAATGRAVTIFGHPLERPLEWSGVCELVDPVQGGFDQADFAHQCDTEAGNSGSTVLDAQTGEVVGIHAGGVAPYNYGTAILRTPISEFEKYYSGREEVPPLDDEAGTLSFGKLDLGNDQNDKMLVALEKAGKATVNFTLTVNLEGQFDSVTLEDADGRRSSRITGKDSFDMTGMKAPVKILFNSDASGLSTLVKISRISYF